MKSQSMKKKQVHQVKGCVLFLLLLFLVFSFPLFSGSIATLNGSAHLERAQYDSLQVNGVLTCKDLVVKESLVTNGGLQGEEIWCKSMRSNGSVQVDHLCAHRVQVHGSFLGENVEITSELECNGGLEIKQGKIHDVHMTSARSTFIDTHVGGNVHVRKLRSEYSFFGLTFSESRLQVVELRGNSIVKGDVLFEQEGEVHLFDEAKIEGRITNAAIVRR